MDSLRVHIDETLTTIKQTFDDRTVSRAQVAYCYIVAANDLLSKHILKRRSGAYLTVFDDVPVISAEASEVKNVVKDRKYIELPATIFDYDKDGGIELVAYTSDGGPGQPPRFTRVPFTRTSVSEASWLYLHPQTTPSPKTPYYYRVGNLVYFLGVEKVPLSAVEIGLYVSVDPLTKIDIDAPFDFPQELMQTLKRLVIDLIRYNWFFPKESGKNEGTDDSGKAAVPKVISVNDRETQ
jgi:hypothetical protein